MSERIIGPGSQPPESDGEIAILDLPDQMETYAAPYLPEPQELDDISFALAVLGGVEQGLKHFDQQGRFESDSVVGIDDHQSEFINQALGEGEVSVKITKPDGSTTRFQESVFAGVWRGQTLDEMQQLVEDWIEVAPIPARAISSMEAGGQSEVTLPEQLPPGVINAPALFAEINDQVKRFQQTGETHVINLTLLPQTEADLAFLNESLAQGCVTVLSRGYGNCRITSTGTTNVWWVQYFNSQDRNILNSLEITKMPEVACAAPEDIADSAERLLEVLEIYR